MQSRQLKPKKCRECGKPFQPFSTLARTCSVRCAIAFTRADMAKEKRKDYRRARLALKPRGKRLREAQAAFNAYVRYRDRNQPCISCGKPAGGDTIKGGVWDCGHYRSTGAAAHLRFNLRNAHKQCIKCNRFLSGSVVDYRIRLINRIGLAAVESLEADNTARKFDSEYLDRVKKIFRKKLRLKKALLNVKNF